MLEAECERARDSAAEVTERGRERDRGARKREQRGEEGGGGELRIPLRKRLRIFARGNYFVPRRKAGFPPGSFPRVISLLLVISAIVLSLGDFGNDTGGPSLSPPLHVPVPSDRAHRARGTHRGNRFSRFSERSNAPALGFFASRARRRAHRT